MLINCSTDYITNPSVTSGKYGIHYATHIIPLCSGWVLYADTQNNKIQAVNAMYQTIGSSYALNAPPGEMAYDSTTGLLYVTLSGSSYLAVVNLNTSAVNYVLMQAPAIHVAATSNGYVFASLDVTVVNWPTEYISYINGSTASVVGTVSMTSFGNNAYMACSSAGTTLFVGADGCGNCTTYEYLFNTSTYTLTQLYTGPGTYTSNGEEMDLSPDGNHLAWVNGGGNGLTSPNNYSILDLMASNINNNYGFWVTGAYPYSAGFDPSTTNIATTNGVNLQVWGVSSHSISKATWINASAGNLGTVNYTLTRTRFSAGGNIIYGLDVPSGTSYPATLLWETFP
jgi:hypothetical protein